MAGTQPAPRADTRRHRGGPGVSGPELTSVRSPRVVAARRLAKRAFRERERRFLVEGPQAVREAVTEPGAVDEIFVATDATDRHPELVRAAQRAGALVHVASGEVIRSLTDTVTPQGIVAVCRYLDISLATVLAAEPRLAVVLAKVRDPGNAGTIIRAADAAGADAVVFTNGSVDPHNPKCVRATAGSIFHLPVVAGITAAEATTVLRGAGLRVVAADGHGSQDLDAALDAGELAVPTAWVFGNEAWGLPADTLALADAVVRIPIHGRAESLNLAAAAAVCLYASARSQRRAERVLLEKTRPHERQ